MDARREQPACRRRSRCVRSRVRPIWRRARPRYAHAPDRRSVRPDAATFPLPPKKSREIPLPWLTAGGPVFADTVA